MSNTYKDLLVTVSKPSRYMGHEINSIQKDMSEVKTRVAFRFVKGVLRRYWRF
ncbi:MAG: hypothetical protein HZA08_14680 [Nitrospirae bacterium]|nr:hypothetical protein [Nitrospirota bacterium]